jgi:hypothetical protein
MSITATYRRQHEEIVDLVGEIVAYFAPGRLPEAAGAARAALDRLAKKLTVHLALEDGALYPRLKAHHDTALRQAAETFSNEMSGIKTAFRSYNYKWGEAEIGDDAERFIVESGRLFAVLGKRIERENAVLYALYDHCDAATAAPAAVSPTSSPS